MCVCGVGGGGIFGKDDAEGKEKKKKGGSSGTVRLCLHFLALLGWVSCNEEVAIASAHYNLIQKETQSAAPLYYHLIAFCEIGINLHCLSLDKQSS